MMSRSALAALATLGSLVAVGVVATAGAASAEDWHDWSKNVYLRLDTGASFSTAANRNFGNGDLGNSYTVGGGVGYRFDPHWRTDVTLGYRGDYGFSRTNNFGSARGDLDALVGLVNGYYDIGTYAGFTPYVGGGVGFSSNHFDRTGIGLGPLGANLNRNTNTDFAWQVSAGVSYAVTPNWALDFGYRYLDMGEARTGDVLTVNGLGSAAGATQRGDLQAHEIQVGVRYSF
jgi:opacity protein-like surface antigen